MSRDFHQNYHKRKISQYLLVLSASTAAKLINSDGSERKLYN